MPDEITTEQWREWRDDHRTKRLAAKMEADALMFDELAARSRSRAIANLDSMQTTSDLAAIQEERRIMAEFRLQAGTVRRWLTVVKSPGDHGAVANATAGPRRVTVQG